LASYYAFRLAWFSLLRNKRRFAALYSFAIVRWLIGIFCRSAKTIRLKPRVPITAYGIGYWLWATSAAVVVAAMGFEM
jgi:hypothetical protein